MVSSDFRKEARNRLTGKWGKVALITFLYLLIFAVLEFLLNKLFNKSVLSSIIIWVVQIPVILGLSISFIKIYNSENSETFDFLTLGFKNFSRAWYVFGNILKKLLIPAILLVASIIFIGVTLSISIASTSIISAGSSSVNVVGIIFTIIGGILYIFSLIWLITKSYYYQIAYFVAADNENLSAKDVVAKSEELMKEQRGNLFVLQLTFIGWALLACLTFGIGMIWLTPYIQFSTIAFYKNLLNANAGNVPNNSTDSENIN